MSEFSQEKATERPSAQENASPALRRFQCTQRMSQAVATGNLVFLSGQVAMNAQGASIAAQTTHILATIDDLLGQAGSDRHHLVSATIWLANRDDYDAFNAIWDDWVPRDAAPARACVEARLMFPQFAVEVAVTALRVFAVD